MKLTANVLISLAFAGAGSLLSGQQITGTITQGEKPSIAVTDMRGAGDAQRFMDRFNSTLWDELSNSGTLNMKAKSLYPLNIPQRPQDFHPPSPSSLRGGAPVSNGPWLTDWSGPPVSANYLAFGYTAVQDGKLVLFGWLFNLAQPDLTSAQVIGKLYFGTLDEEGAKKVARDFAADILQQFGAKSLAGTKIFFVSDRSGFKEIWSMDYDGSNQKQLTFYKSPVASNMPAVSPDGKLVAFTTFPPGKTPQIMIYSVETGKKLPFYNPPASMNATPEFTPDGRHILFSSTFNSPFAQIYEASTEGTDLHRLSNVRAIEVSPRVNPKTGTDIAFISGRSGHAQLYIMNSEGADVQRLTEGDGDVANPSWRPDGKYLAFCWTRGFEPGNFNVFLMEVASKQLTQLTHGSGRNENPWWAPDGLHLVFSRTVGRSTQLYTMLADGTNVRQLTTRGNNFQPVWAKGMN